MTKNWETNRKNYLAKVAEQSVSVFFAGDAPVKSADEHYRFTPNRNFYYLTGLAVEKAIVLLVKTARVQEATLFIERPNPQLARWVGATISREQAQQQSGIEKVLYLDEFGATFGQLWSRNAMATCYCDLERQTFEQPDTCGLQFAKTCQQKYPGLRLENAWPICAQLRMIKSEAEIAEIEAAIAITAQGIAAMRQALKPGLTENQIEAHFDFTLKQAQVSDFAFPTICAAGKNATVLHYIANNQPLHDGDLILFDLGAQVNYYNADISRTFPINGRFSERQKQLYTIVLEAMNAVEAAVKPGVTLRELNDIAIAHLAQGCLAIGLITQASEIHEYYIHSIGHHLGLDTHDASLNDIPLQPGMVITNEPGLYLEAEGIGIRIEDDLLVTETGCRNLAVAIPKTLAELEGEIK